MKRPKLIKKKWLILITILLLAAIVTPTVLVLTIGGDARRDEDTSKKEESKTEQKPEVSKSEEKPAENTNISTQTPPPDQQTPTYPVTLTSEQAASLTVVVNKKYKLPSDYAPNLAPVLGGQLRPEAADALTQLVNAASQAGHSLSVISSYRSYANQQSTYNGWVAQYGQAEADTFSARPGHSEHQTGLAVDLNSLEQSFGSTPAGLWLAANAQNYGFIIRYPEGKDAETGYHYEPWHIRYVGVDVAKAVVASGKTLDQYYNIPAGGY